MSYEIEREHAEKTMKDHQYTLLAEGNGCEIWRCARPGTNVYAFNICVAPMGISVVGDIGDLTFGVYDRGISFLAGKDVGYYIHSKLTENCKDTDYNASGIKRNVIENVVCEIENVLSGIDEERCNAISFTFDYDNEPTFEQLKEFVHDTYVNSKENDQISDFFRQVNDFLDDVDDLTHADEAYHLLDNCKVISFNDHWEYSYTEPSSSLITKLYMINRAAIEINDIKNESKEG